MPRRNRRHRPGWSKRPIEVEPPPPTYEQLARALVKAGRCSVQILDNPQRFTSTRSNPVD
jgi:hypothetical protein